MITTTDWPFSVIFFIWPKSSRLRCGSSGEVGSSRNSRLGLVSSSRPMLTRFFWPPDSRTILVFACWVISSSPSTSSTRWFLSASVMSGGNLSSAA